MCHRPDPVLPAQCLLKKLEMAAESWLAMVAITCCDGDTTFRKRRQDSRGCIRPVDLVKLLSSSSGWGKALHSESTRIQMGISCQLVMN